MTMTSECCWMLGVFISALQPCVIMSSLTWHSPSIHSKDVSAVDSWGWLSTPKGEGQSVLASWHLKWRQVAHLHNVALNVHRKWAVAVPPCLLLHSMLCLLTCSHFYTDRKRWIRSLCHRRMRSYLFSVTSETKTKLRCDRCSRSLFESAYNCYSCSQNYSHLFFNVSHYSQCKLYMSIVFY